MARGSIKPRPMKDGTTRYRVKWESRGADGKRRYHSATCATKKEAERLLTEKLAEVETGTHVVATRETVAQFLERWLAASEPRWSEASSYQYRGVIKKRILPYLGHVPLARLDELAIQECYAKLLAAGYAPRSVTSAHNLLDSALAQAVDWRLLPRNPAQGVKAPVSAVAAPTVWTAEEATAFLVATEGDAYGVLWRLGLDSGMRIGEMLGLTWRDVDLEQGVVSVRRTLTRSREGGHKLGELAKTASSRRSIVLGSATVAALRSQRARQAERRLACGAAWTDHGLVFDRGNGQWIYPALVSRALARAIKRTGVPALTLHGLRHTMATLLLGAGVHPKIVQERLGHKSITMTLDRYSHVSMTMQQSAATVLNGLLGAVARPQRGQDAV